MKKKVLMLVALCVIAAIMIATCSMVAFAEDSEVGSDPTFSLRENPLYGWADSSVSISTISRNDFHAWSGDIFAEFGGIDFAFTYSNGSFFIYYNIVDTSSPINDAMFQIRITLGEQTLFFNLKYNGNSITALEYQEPNIGGATNLFDTDGADSYVIKTDKGWAGEIQLPITTFKATITEGQDYTIEYIVTYVRFDLGTKAFGSGTLGEDDSYSPNTAVGVNYNFTADITMSTLLTDKTEVSYYYNNPEDIAINLSGLVGGISDITVSGISAESYTLNAGETDGTAVLTIKKEALTSQEGYSIVVTDTKNVIEKNNNVSIKLSAVLPELKADKTKDSYTYKSAEDIVIALSGLSGTSEDLTVSGIDASGYTLEAGEEAHTVVLTIKKEVLTSKEGFSVIVTDTANDIERNNNVKIDISVKIPDNYGEAKLADGEDPSKNSEKGDVKIKLVLAGEQIVSLSYNKKELKAGEDYVYDATTGILTIKASYLGNRTINKRTFVLKTEDSQVTFNIKYTPDKADDSADQPSNTPTNPDGPSDNIENNGEKDNTLMIVLIVVGAVVLIGGGVTAFIIIKKKKANKQ